MNYRSQLQNWRATGARFANLPNCTPITAAPAAPLSTSDVIPPVSASAPAPALLVALSPVAALDLSSGSVTRSGTVSSGQQVYSFSGKAGDRVVIEISVTRIMAGTTFADDDSQLFLFDGAGRLIAENDDDRSFQSRIRNFTLPYDGPYFVVVTTFNNDPILNPSRIVTQWESDGGSNIEYRLTITAAPQ